MKLTADDRAALQGAISVLAEILQQSPDETPDIIKQWPANDEDLRGEFWKDRDGDIYRFSDEYWEVWQLATRQWVEILGLEHLDNDWAPFTRATDPSLPRTWDSLDDVPEDVERVTGDYGGTRRELARSGLCESGWFQRAKGGPLRGWDDLFTGWMELTADQATYVKNIREER